MRKTLVGAALLILAGGAQAAQAQVPSVVPSVKPSLYAGLAVPTGDFKDGVNSGYTVGGALDLTLPAMPLAWRGELSYTNFGLKSDVADGSVSDVSGRVNAVIPMHLIVATPYIIGGVGYYHVTTDVTNVGSSSDNKFGYNVGVGVDLPLGTLGARIEARYHHVSMDGGGAYSYIPITFGLRF
jgi:opacity protein-like surface antigen